MPFSNISRLLSSWTDPVKMERSPGCEGCGEAVCVTTTPGTFVCRCELSLLPPLEGRCHQPDPPRHENISSVLFIHNIKTIFRLNNTSQQNSTQILPPDPQGGERTRLIFILLPLLVLLVGMLLVLVFLWRRRKQRARTKGGVVSQDAANLNRPLLEQLRVLATNPAYFGTGDTCQNLLKSKLIDKTVAREQIVIHNMIGQGLFGQVFKGELKQNTDTIPVAVKIQKAGVDSNTLEDFSREIVCMASFDHKNILKLLAIVGDVSTDIGEGPYAVFEFMKHGDLASLLRKTDPTMRGEQDEYVPVDREDQVKIALQIAEGMQYLSSMHFVHRDLAARNVLVGENLSVKISDFGMSRDVYSMDYYKVSGSKMLPVRWMSIESVKYGKFTLESDIWSFGVVLWEIYTYGKQPYTGYSNREVIRQLENGILLSRPPGCASTMYHLMLACWKLTPKQRITFDRVMECLSGYLPHVNQDTLTPCL